MLYIRKLNSSLKKQTNSDFFTLTIRNIQQKHNIRENYKLFGFQHRIVLRLSLFSHKIMNIPSAPAVKMSNIVQQ